MKSELRLLDKSVQKYMDVFRATFIEFAEMTLFPELCEVFGPDAVIRFIDLFAGSVITVPSREFITQSVEAVDIYTSLIDDPDCTEALARKYEKTVPEIRAVFNRVRRRLEKLHG